MRPVNLFDRSESDSYDDYEPLSIDETMLACAARAAHDEERPDTLHVVDHPDDD